MVENQAASVSCFLGETHFSNWCCNEFKWSTRLSLRNTITIRIEDYEAINIGNWLNINILSHLRTELGWVESHLSSCVSCRNSRARTRAYLQRVLVVGFILLPLVERDGAVPHQHPHGPALVVDQEDLRENDYSEHGEEHDDYEEADVGPLLVAERRVPFLPATGGPHPREVLRKHGKFDVKKSFVRLLNWRDEEDEEEPLLVYKNTWFLKDLRVFRGSVVGYN